MPTVQIRKLIAMGAGGLVITIHKPWWRYWDLKAGDEVRVIADGELRIRPLRKKKVNRRRRVGISRQLGSSNPPS